MALSNELINAFVKATNDKTDIKQEATLYGTVFISDGVRYVTLDGSTELTPVSSLVTIADGDRVKVSIKNHRATITGNLSSVSASSGDVITVSNEVNTVKTLAASKVDTTDLDAVVGRVEILETNSATVKNLEAAEARIYELETDNVTVNKTLAAQDASIKSLETEKLDAEIADIKYATVENLEATDASIHNLEATYGDFQVLTTNKFAAVDASIDDLTANKLSAKDAEITYAKITELEAAVADINVLESDVATIDTLIFGSASGSTIQTSFANAVIAQLGNAQIKSAMIENVSADKITTGDIITNNVRVKSQNGSLLISDETIQISDDTRVRVQIGKDASNDYSINIWDTDGNIMFSKGGITDSAIKDAIIRNDMVSDTANISAHKLDIDSLFEEINGSTNTIKSTQIHLNDENQTLDVAFKELSTEVTDLGETVTSQGTQISAIQGQITSKIWQQDIDAATNEMSTQYSTLEQEVDGISATVANHTTQINQKADSSTVTAVSDKVTTLETGLSGFQSTVSETYATKTELNDLDIGGRNLVATSYLTESSWGIGFNGNSTKEFTAKSWVGNAINNARIKEIFKSGETYTIYCEIEIVELPEYTDNGMFDSNVAFYVYSPSTNYDKMLPATLVEGEKGALGAKYILNKTFVFPEIQDDTYLAMYTCLYKNSSGGAGATTTVKVTNFKIEKGDKATDWTPAPEDIQSDINAAQSVADTALATANQNAADMAAIVTDFNSDIQNLQTQIDGSITTWFYEVAPTTSNEPAKNWTTTDLKNIHLGDLYYNTITGYCYRWQVQNNTYSWQRITDTDVTKALADARTAQDTADQKRRVFYVQPTPPYDAGDLWVQGSGGDILRCKTAKTSGQNYALSDWVAASKYTDDTAATAANNNALAAQSAAANAQTGVNNLGKDVSALETRVTNAETSISQNTDAIALRATKTEVSTAKSEAISAASSDATTKANNALSSANSNTANLLKSYSTTEQMNSAIELKANSITSNVSETYATKTALSATDAIADAAYKNAIRKSGTIDLTSEEYDVDTYYPVAGNGIPSDGYHYIGVNVQLNSGSVPSWSTHGNGFTCNISVRMKACGWGTVNYETIGWIDDFSYNFCDKMPAYINQNRNSSRPILYLRGGGKYFVYTDYDTPWTVYAQDYTDSNITFSPTNSPTNYPSLVNNWNTVSRVTNAETKIVQNADSITSLAKRTTAAEGRIDSTESSIEQLSNRISANVTETTSLGTRMSTVEQTADSLTIELDNLTVGGRNYILKSGTMIAGSASTGITPTVENGILKVVVTSGNENWHSWAKSTVANENLVDGDPFTFSVDIKCEEGSTGKPSIYIKSGLGYYILQGAVTTEYTRLYYTGTWKTANNVQFHFGWNSAVGTFYIRRPKLEKGNRATDWSPAPEDINSDISDAARTATDYLNFSSSGLVIGDMTASTLGKNVLIDSDSVDIRNGSTTLASFGADYLYLAKNSRDATIDFCNGLAKMYHTIDDKGYSIFNVDTTYGLSYIKMSAPMHDLLVLENTAATNGVIIKGVMNGTTVGGFGLVRDGYMVRYGSDADEDNPVEYAVLDTGNFSTEMDTGWKYGGVLGENFTIYSNDDGSQCRYRKMGNLVEIRGTVRPTQVITGSADNHTIFTLPEGYRPDTTVNILCQGSGAYSWLLSITSAGLVRFARYNDGAKYVDTSTSSWLPFHAIFFID